METYTYSIPNDSEGNPRTNAVVRSDGWTIPTDPSNSDYQAYLATLVTESAPTAQQGVALLIQPPLGVGFFLPRKGQHNDTR